MTELIDPSEVLSLSEAESSILYGQIEDIIESMDAKGINEMLKMSGNDFDKLLCVLMEETNNVVNLHQYKDSVPMLADGSLPAVKAGYEDYLRKKSLLYFVSSVLPEYELAWHCIEWLSMIQLYRFLCVICARDHSKSYTFSFAQILWRLYRYEKPSETYIPPADIKYYREGMLITNEFKLAKKLLKKVKEEIKLNPILSKRLYPEGRNATWANESIQCTNGAEVTLSSFRTSNRGPHPGWIVVDDFLDKSAMYSKDQREKFKEVFNAEIMNMILPQGQVCVVGTPFHEKDLYHDLKEDPSWAVFEYPALFPDGSVLWDNRYDFESLKKKRTTLGPLIFSREILVRPVSDSTTIFPWYVLEKSFVGTTTISMAPNRASFPVKMKKVAIGVDWALSANVGADDSWFVVLGEDYAGQMWLMWFEVLHGARYNAQISKLRALNIAFDADIIVAETNVFQKVMADLAKDAGITNIVEEVTGNNKKDIYEGLPALVILFDQYKYKFPRGDARSVEKTNLLCSQLNSIAFDDDKGTLESVSEHDDGCMALYFATKGIKSINGVFRVSTT